MNPTSCPSPLFALSDSSALLDDLPRSNQSAMASPFAGVEPHSCCRVFKAYSAVGKNPDVHVLGTKSCQSPTVVSVY